MKEAFEKYFEKLTKNYKDTFNSKPTIPFSKNIEKKIVVSKRNEDDYIEWEPVLLQKKPDFSKISKKLGFELCQDLKDFYSTYLFGELSGNFEGKELIFQPIINKKIKKIIQQNYKDGQWLFPNSQMFMLGIAVVNGNDNCFVCFDNAKKELFVYNNEEGQQENIALPSLNDVIANIEPPFAKEENK